MATNPEGLVLTKKPSFTALVSTPARRLLKSLSKTGHWSPDRPSESATADDHTLEGSSATEEYKDELSLETPAAGGAEKVQQEQGEGGQEEQGGRVETQEEEVVTVSDPAPEATESVVPVAAAALPPGLVAEPVVDTMNGNGVYGEAQRSSIWQIYRKRRLSKASKPIYLLTVVIAILLFGAAGIKQKWSTAFGRLSRDVELVETPALTRGGPSVLVAGDFMYSCRPSKEEGVACEPTIFFLREDGVLILARGTAPSAVTEQDKIWQSGTPKQSQQEESGVSTAYNASYNEGGILMVKDDKGKTVWRRRPIFTPRFLRPWPLAA